MLSLYKTFRARPRLVIAFGLGGVLLALLPDSLSLPTRLLAGWDASTFLYLLLVFWMMKQASADDIKCHAKLEDEGRGTILILSIIATCASIVAILAELAAAKSGGSHIVMKNVALTAATVSLSWLFLHTIFALHYAQEYYTVDQEGGFRGLQFPGNEMPDYWDFIYFSYIIGAAAQTADVQITAARTRKFCTLHCVIAFFFNTTILALTVNIAASLI